MRTTGFGRRVSEDSTPKVKGKTLDKEKRDLVAKVTQTLINDGNSRLASLFSEAFIQADSKSGWADKDGVVISVQEFRGTLESWSLLYWYD